MTLFYLPLEPYRSRYTYQLSAANWGWYERNWIKAGIDYIRVDPGMAVAGPEEIKIGGVLDAFKRCKWAMRQVDILLGMIESGQITSDDVILLDDFWHPGIESVPYACHLKGVKPKVFAYWWAQSVDEFDFTYQMRDWMRHHELSQLSWLDGVFVACPSMRKAILDTWNNVEWDYCPVHVVGLPFDSREVLGRCPAGYQNGLIHEGMDPMPGRKNQVVFSSRWDTEKNPYFFMQVADRILRSGKIPDVTFVVCTGAKQLKSNYQFLVEQAKNMQEAWPTRFVVCENLSKAEYYQALCESKVQFNCASQDWVSFTLLEASVCGAYPIYPRFRSFPETLDGVPGQNYLYTHKNLDSAIAGVEWALGQDDLWTPEAIRGRSWIHRRFDYTWGRMLDVMEVPISADKASGELMTNVHRDPFANSKW